MKKSFFLLALFVLSLTVNAQNNSYYPLDINDPVQFFATYIIYGNNTIQLGPKAFFIDGRLTSEEIADNPFVFNTINEAAKHLTDGTEDEPMVLYIAPWVYWIDNPDDPEVRDPGDGSVPYGLVIKCDWLRFYGLNQNPENVVLACNRGQTLGAKGNFTMFRFWGNGTSSENITFGNYCNVDLKYPLNPELNRKKRSDAIVQAQLIHCNGDKIIARNTHFISRLNLCNFVGAKRILFENCHMECTDDALCGTGVYKDCTFDFYSSKPFYHTSGTGAVFLNCDIRSYTRGTQYFTKANGQVAVIDTRFHADALNYIGWRDFPPPFMKNYQSNVTLNGKQITISKNDPQNTIDITGSPELNAYKFNYKGKVIYNTFNLLKGNDDWDPEGIKETVLKAEKENKISLTKIPVQLKIKASENTIETGKDASVLKVDLIRFGNYEAAAESVNWNISERDKAFIKTEISKNGNVCEVIPANTSDSVQKVLLTASNISGLEGAISLSIKPAKLNPPAFVSLPKIEKNIDGTLSVNYRLEKMKYEDESLVSWFRCSDANCENPIETAVSRQNKPLLHYELSAGDIGYYIMVKVAPKHLRSDAGPLKSYILQKPIRKKDVNADPLTLQTDFMNVCVKNQPEVIPGFWRFAPFDTSAIKDFNRDAWYVGEGSGGSEGMTGLLQTGRYASMSYTPVGPTFGDMRAELTITPFKTAGQGFSVAPLYMDVLISYNPVTKTGYGIRFIRKTKFANTVEAYLVEYNNGYVNQLTEAVSTSCFRPQCRITIELTGDKLTAHAFCLNDYYKAAYPPKVKDHVDLEAIVLPNREGSFGIEYNGGATTMINELVIKWDK
ncbi:hypothetical protein ACE01N_12715 [Saccharicrinis sp. FJH2]|uniref:hypothetical protein n=1 Tax=Saccharicrinis sp. FJH65 TaxID=3344659 RepID=UPI0035F4880E